jgi:hypothetical protein
MGACTVVGLSSIPYESGASADPCRFQLGSRFVSEFYSVKMPLDYSIFLNYEVRWFTNFCKDLLIFHSCDLEEKTVFNDFTIAGESAMKNCV